MNRDLRLQVVFSAVDKITGQLKGITQGGTAMADKLAAARKQLKALETQQKDVRGFQDLRRQVQQTSTALKDQQDKVKGLAQQMSSTSNPTTKLTREFNAAQKQAARLKREHAAQQTELQGLRTRLHQTGIQTKALDDHDRRLRSEKQRLNRTIDEQTKKLKNLGEVQQKQKALNERHGRSMMHVGMLAGAGYAGMATGRNMLQRGAAALMPGIDFGAQMSELQAVSRLESEDPRLAMLRRQAKDLGATTQFTAPEVGAGQTFLARAGFSPEAINSSMSDVLAMALANNTDLARTADIASNIAGAFKIDPEVAGNMTRVADVLSGTAARGNVNLEMMGDTMK
jgi:hypothetical protein